MPFAWCLGKLLAGVKVTVRLSLSACLLRCARRSLAVVRFLVDIVDFLLAVVEFIVTEGHPLVLVLVNERQFFGSLHDRCCVSRWIFHFVDARQEHERVFG
jgi:hypothetical protein